MSNKTKNSIRELSREERSRVNGGYIMGGVHVPPMEQRLEQSYDRTFYPGGSSFGDSAVRH